MIRSKAYTAHNNRSTGATMVETAIFLPVVLIIILGCIWISVMSNAQAAFHNALTQALRLAATRSDPTVINTTSGAIPVVQAWYLSNADPSTSAYDPLGEMLLYDGAAPPPHLAAWNTSLYSSTQLPSPPAPPPVKTAGTLAYFAAPPPPNLSVLPTPYIYSILYINQTMRQAVGNSIRFSCDPYSAGGSGCLNCYFLPPIGSTSIDAGVTPTDIQIRCDFRPDTIITNTLYALIRLLAKLSPGVMSAIVMSDTKNIVFATGAVS